MVHAPFAKRALRYVRIWIWTSGLSQALSTVLSIWLRRAPDRKQDDVCKYSAHPKTVKEYRDNTEGLGSESYSGKKFVAYKYTAWWWNW